MYILVPFSEPENKIKIQFTQNNCIRFCLKFNSRHHIRVKKFKETKLATNKRKCWTTHPIKNFKSRQRTSSFFVNELFVPSRNTHKIRSHVALETPLRKSNLGQRSISVLELSVWNKLSNDLKTLKAVASFTSNYKKLLLLLSLLKLLLLSLLISLLLLLFESLL